MAEEPVPFIIDADWLKPRFLAGLDLTDALGVDLPESMFEMAIAAAKREFARRCNIVVPKTTIADERHDWNAAAQDEFSFLSLLQIPVRSKPVFKLVWGNRDIWHVPDDWVYQDPTEPEQIQVIPTTGAYPISVAELAFSQHVVLHKYQRFPGYYSVSYDAGLDDADFDDSELMCIGKMAAIFALTHVGNMVLGPGITGQSASIDGASTSRNTAKSGSTHAYSHMTMQWQREVDQMVALIRSQYHGMNLLVV